MTQSRIRVAVIEDDLSLQQLFRDVLADEGFDVTIAEGEHDLPASWRGEIVVTDSTGNAYDRDALVARVARLRRLGAPKIVVSSAHFEIERDQPELGADAVLRKPFEIEELIAVLRGVTA